jgi:hypothetical protein
MAYWVLDFPLPSPGDRMEQKVVVEVVGLSWYVAHILPYKYPQVLNWQYAAASDPWQAYDPAFVD